jgi:hypothetical protein
LRGEGDCSDVHQISAGALSQLSNSLEYYVSKRFGWQLHVADLRSDNGRRKPASVAQTTVAIK